MSINKSGVLACIIAVAISTFVLCYTVLGQPKIGYIDIKTVFDGFELKKDLEKKYKTVVAKRNKVIDSLYLDLKIASNSIENKREKDPEKILDFRNKSELYNQQRIRFEEDNNALSTQYDSEILAQLNQYIQDYGDQNGYLFILGNQGDGTIMQARDSKNLTKEIIEYTNKRYNDKK